MKQVLVLHGSARRGGDTDTLADRFLAGLGPKPDVRHFVPIEMNIAHCRACMQCASGTGCVIHDDMDAVYPALRDARIVILATPMFWGYMTSQMKTLFDRLESVVSPEYFGRKEFVLLVGYRHYYGSIVEWLDRIARGFGSRSHAVLCRTYDPQTATDLRIAEIPEKLNEAYALGRRLAIDCLNVGDPR